MEFIQSEYFNIYFWKNWIVPHSGDILCRLKVSLCNFILCSPVCVRNSVCMYHQFLQSSFNSSMIIHILSMHNKTYIQTASELKWASAWSLHFSWVSTDLLSWVMDWRDLLLHWNTFKWCVWLLNIYTNQSLTWIHTMLVQKSKLCSPSKMEEYIFIYICNWSA